MSSSHSGRRQSRLTRKRPRKPFAESLEQRCVLTSGVPGTPVLDLDSSLGIIEDLSRVSEWQDQSSQGNHLFSSGDMRPVIGSVTTPTGLSALRFDGLDDRLLRDLNSTGGITGLPTGNAGRTMFLVAQFHDANAWGGAVYGTASANQTFGVGVSKPGNFILQGSSSGNDLISSELAFDPPGTTNGWAVLSAVHVDDGSNPADNGFLYKDSVQIASWDHQFNTNLGNAAILDGSTRSRVVLGEEARNLGHQEVDVAAVVVYDTALDATERVNVENYLYSRYVGTTGTGPFDLDGFSNESVISSGLAAPIALGFLPNNRMLVVEKGGEIHIADPNTGNKSLYLDISNIVDSGNERGLLEIAIADDFDPDPALGKNFVYLYYTRASSTNRAVIARFEHLEGAGGLASTASVNSEQILWTDTDGLSSCCHYGGGLDFGPDGKLWLTGSDKFNTSNNGEGGSDDNWPLNVESTSGKIIRINRDGSIPDGTDGWPSNPYVDGIVDGPYPPSSHPEFGGILTPDPSIWAYGLRNPFRADWDEEYGYFYIGEVGGNQGLSTDDLHLASLDQSGAFYGWNFYEGKTNVQPAGSVTNFDPADFPQPDTDLADPGSGDFFSAPIFDIDHSSFTGGFVYRGGMFPAEFDGVYFFGNYEDNYIKFLDLDETGTVVNGVYDLKPSTEIPGNANNIVFLDEGKDGALYYINYTGTGGQVQRIVYEGAQSPQINTIGITDDQGDPNDAFGPVAPLNVVLTATVSDSDTPVGDLSYTINFGDGSSAVMGSPDPVTGDISVSHQYVSIGSYNVVLTVSDGVNSTFSQPIVVIVGDPNDPPVFLSATGDPQFGDPGLLVTFTAEVDDPDTSDPVESLTYVIDFGDGSPTVSGNPDANGQIAVTHAYNEASVGGPFNAFFTISDGEAPPVQSVNIPIQVGTSSQLPVTNGLVFQVESFIKVGLNGDIVTEWLDESGQGNNLIATGDPQYVPNATPSGLPAIVLDGTGDYLSRVDSASTPINGLSINSDPRTMFFVVDYEDVTNNKYAGLTYGNNANNEAFGLTLDGNSDDLTVQGWGRTHDRTTDVDGVIDPNNGQQRGFISHAVVYDGTSYEHYLNGTLIDSGAKSYGTVIDELVLGRNLGSGETPMSVAAAFIYDRALTPAEFTVVEDYIENTYLSAAPIGPPVNQGLVGYFESDINVLVDQNDVVTEWLSGAGTNMDLVAAGDPTLVAGATPSGRDAIRFDGTGDWLERTAPSPELPTGDAPRSIYVVADYKQVGNSAGVAYGTAAANQAFGLIADSSTNNLAVEGFGSGQDLVSAEDAIGNNDGSIGDDWFIQSVRYDGATVRHYRDNTSIEETARADYATAFNRFVIGQDIAGTGDGEQLDVAAVFVYDRELNATEHNATIQYLTDKYLTSSANSPPQITVVGSDSAAETLIETDAGLTINGTLSVEDLDLTDTVDASLISVVESGDGMGQINNATLLAMMNVGANPVIDSTTTTGTLNWSFDSGSEAFDFLNLGQSLLLTYTLRATDSPSGSFDDQTVTITIDGTSDGTGGVPTTGLVLQLESDTGVTVSDSRVSQWADQTDNSNHLLGSGVEQPVYGSVQTPSGLDALSFDGTNDRLIRTFGDGLTGLPSGNADRSTFMVVQFHDANAWAGFGFGAGSANEAYGTGVVSTGGNRGKVFLQGWGSGNDQISNVDGFTVSGTAGWMIVSSVLTADGADPADNAFMYIDGTEVVAWSHDYATDLLDPVKSRIALGQEIAQRGHARMDVAAVFVYDVALDGTGRQQVEEYLFNKYLGASNSFLAAESLNDEDFKPYTNKLVEDSGGEVGRFAGLLALSRGFGKKADAVWADGDFNGNGAVDFADFLAWARNMGAKRRESID